MRFELVIDSQLGKLSIQIRNLKRWIKHQKSVTDQQSETAISRLGMEVSRLEEQNLQKLVD